MNMLAVADGKIKMSAYTNNEKRRFHEGFKD